MIKKFQDLPEDPPVGFKVEITAKTVRILADKINELIEAVNKQEEAIKQLAFLQESGLWEGAEKQINSILSGEDKP